MADVAIDQEMPAASAMRLDGDTLAHDVEEAERALWARRLALVGWGNIAHGSGLFRLSPYAQAVYDRIPPSTDLAAGPARLG